MKLAWLGHSSFLLTTSQGTTLLTDPYDETAYAGEFHYAPAGITADVITVSHAHRDHYNKAVCAKSAVISTPGTHRFKDIEIEGIPSFHDKAQGRQRGENVIFKLQADGVSVVHFGDLGTPDIAYEKIGSPDAALVPVGGTFTIDFREAQDLVKKIQPGIIIPMHFENEKIEFGIDGVERFLQGDLPVERDAGSLTVVPKRASSQPRIVVMRPLR